MPALFARPLRGLISLRGCVVTGAALMLVVGVAGCSSSGGSNASATPTATTGTADAAWAGEVCTGVSGVQAAVKNLGDGIKINPADAGASLTAAKAQLTTQLTAVENAAQQLVTTATTLPAGTSSDIQAKQDTLKSQADALRSALDSVKTAAADVPAVTSPQDFVSSVADMVVPLTTAALDAKLLVTTLNGFTSSTKAKVKAAFEAAPTCQALKA